MKFSFLWRVGLAISISCFSSVAFGQTPGEPGWFVRVIDSGGTINSLATHNNVLGEGPVLQVDESVHEFIDFNGGPIGADNNPWPIDVVDDFVVRAIADVTIPAGEWAVGWNSDDGGQITIPGIEFLTAFEQNAGETPDNNLGDQIIFDGNRGNRASWGSFSLSEPLETTINVSMWERGGGDNFEVFYADVQDNFGFDAADLIFDDGVPGPDDYSLLGDPDSFFASWDVRVPSAENIPALVIPVAPGQSINGTATNVQSEAVGEIQPGLLHNWYDINNPGSLEGVGEFYDINAGPLEDPDVAAFNPQNTWWTGNQAPLEGGTTEAPQYPAEIIDQPRPNAGGVFGSSDNNNYTTALTGEIRFPRDGEYLFTDGVDDLTVFAVDVNRDGEFDEDEILINDNAWTNLQRDANDGGFPNEYVPIDIDVPEDGNCDDAENASDLCWYRVEAIFGEGGGTDAGIIYWNENEDIEFPAENGEGRVIAAEDIPELAIPEDHLRAPGGIQITAVDFVAELDPSFPYEFEINEDGTFDSLTVNRSVEVGTTALNLNGATIDLVANGDLSGLNGEFQVLSADSLSGDITINVPDGLAVDTSRLASEGVLVFGDVVGPTCNPNTLGDLDGSGTVEFADFLVLSQNFGQEVADHSFGDIDCSGTVEFADFLVLSQNFGQTVGAAESVPEPSALALLGLGGLFVGLMRRRRN